MTPSRRVVVTGVGAVTPLGHSIADTLAALARGESATGGARSTNEPGLPVRTAAVTGFNARQHFRTPKALKLAGRQAQFAVAASAMALHAARWPDDDHAAESLGILLGSSTSDFRAAEIATAIGADPDLRSAHDIAWFTDRMLGGLNPLWLLVALPSMSSAHVAIQFGARGPNNTLMSDWVAGHQAIGEAFDWIRLDEADAVLAGGTDSAVAPITMAAYDHAGLWDRASGDAPAPVPAEGAAVFLLEARDHAMARGAPILAEVNAYANRGPNGASGHGSGGAIACTMAEALAHARFTPGELHAVGTASTAGTSSASAEEAAIACLLNGHARVVRRVGFKSRLGHALAASGPIDLALTLSSQPPGRPPTASLWNAVGYSGQAVTLAVTLGAGEPAEGLRS